MKPTKPEDIGAAQPDRRATATAEPVHCLGVKVGYTSRELYWLWILAVVGFAGVNGAFVWGLLAHPDVLASALKNPLGAALGGVDEARTERSLAAHPGCSGRRRGE
jgi:hypothetical protein